MKNAPTLVRGLAVVFVFAVTAPYAIAEQAAGSRGIAYVKLHLLMTAVMLVAWLAARYVADAAFRWLLVAGVVARVLLVAAEPFTTHDVDRYLWDGRVLLEGIDPYATAPNDPRVAHLRERWPTAEEHATYPTLYPPGALLLFAFAAGSGVRAAPWVWKTIVAAASIALLLVMASLLRRCKLERHLALVALNPLLVLEAGVGAHVDVVAALAVAGALLLFERGLLGRAGLALGAGALVKLTPILAVIPLLSACRDTRGAGRLAAGAAAVVGIGFGVPLMLSVRPWGSMGAFLSGWRFGSPVGLALAELPAGGLIAGLLALAGLAASAWRARRRDPTIAVFVALSLPLLLSPVSFPWYLTVLVPALALSPTAFGVAWLVAVPLTYEVIDRFDATGAWEPALWPLVVVGLAMATGLGLDLYLRRRATAAPE